MNMSSEIVLGLFIGGIIGITIIILSMSPDNSKKDIPPATYYSTVEYDGHTYIQNYGNQSIFHNPDCTNSKCFKE